MSVDAVLIAGPTASGKSAATLELAERLGAVIVNADSMQVYREARILTARPSAEEEARVPHRLYGHVSVREAYSVARYRADAARELHEARAAKRIAIFVGGTGLYFDALTKGLADIPPVPEEIRASAAVRREEIGADAFFAELARRDAQSAAQLRPSDRQRTLRAYEVFEATGQKLSDWQGMKPLPAPLAGLRLARFVISPPRPELRRRIDARFDAMLVSGAMSEAIALEGLDPARPAAKILGLRELWAVRAGKLSLDEAREKAKAASRQYAKRQLTWFRQRMADWDWLEDQGNFVSEMLKNVA